MKKWSFIVVETTRGKKSKYFAYNGIRSKLDTPRVVKFTNKHNHMRVVTFAHRTVIRACFGEHRKMLVENYHNHVNHKSDRQI